MGLGKKIKKFFKKLGKQIKTNLKHGAKYIVPVLVSAMTGGFGSGIVQSLFGGKIAGALSNLGNNTIGKLFGGLGSKAKQITDGAEAVADKGLFANLEPVLSGEMGAANSLGISDIVKNAVPGVTKVLTNSLPGVGNTASLVSKVPLLGAADKLLGAVVTDATKNGLTGALAKTYGGVGSGSTANAGNSGGSSSKANLAELYGNINVNKPGDDAKVIEVDPTNISGEDKKRWQNPDGTVNPEVLNRELQLAFRGDSDKDEEDHRFKSNGYRPYTPFNYGSPQRF